MSNLDDINLRWYLPAVLVMTVFFSLLAASLARGEDVNLAIIARIESSNNPLAYNAKSGACGMYQITAICLKEYNNLNPGRKMPRNALFDPKKAYLVADWYVNKRIPELLKHYYITNTTVKSIAFYKIVCYNWGIGNFIKWYNKGGIYGRLPRETRKYWEKYSYLQNMQ